MSSLIVDIKRSNDKHLLGEEGFELSTLAFLGINIPDGFIVTTDAYFEFIKDNNLRTKVNHLLENFDRNTPGHIKKAFLDSDFSEEFVSKVFSSYRSLGWSDKFVSLIPSTTDSHLKLEAKKVKGEASLLHDIKEIWASYFSSELLSHRIRRDLNHFKTGIAIIVQKDLRFNKSGSIAAERGNVQIDTGNRLSKKESSKLLEIGQKITDLHYFPTKVTWVITKGKIYITNIGPLHREVSQAKVLEAIPGSDPALNEQTEIKPIGGIATGVIGKEIFVFPNLAYDKLSEVKESKAIVIEDDNINPHLRIVLQKMGIPVVIGKKVDLRPGTVATVDAVRNEVYRGEFKLN